MEERLLSIDEVCAVVTLANGCVMRTTSRELGGDPRIALPASLSRSPDRSGPAENIAEHISLLQNDGFGGTVLPAPRLEEVAVDARNRLLSLNAGADCESSPLAVAGERLTLAMSTQSTLLYVARGHRLGAVYASRGILDYFVLITDMRKDVAVRVLSALEPPESAGPPG